LASVTTTRFDIWRDSALDSSANAVADEVVESVRSDCNTIAGIFPPFQSKAIGDFRIDLYAQQELPAGPQTVGLTTHAYGAARDFICTLPEQPLAPADLKEDLSASVTALLVQCFAASTLNWQYDTCLGQALCLAIAGYLHPDAVGVFGPSEKAWLDTSPLDDYINNPATDAGNLAANGCVMLFLSWLRHQGFGWHQIVLAGLPAESTPRTIYRFLSSDDADPFPHFSQLAAAEFGALAPETPPEWPLEELPSEAKEEVVAVSRPAEPPREMKAEIATAPIMEPAKPPAREFRQPAPAMVAEAPRVIERGAPVGQPLSTTATGKQHEPVYHPATVEQSAANAPVYPAPVYPAPVNVAAAYSAPECPVPVNAAPACVVPVYPAPVCPVPAGYAYAPCGSPGQPVFALCPPLPPYPPMPPNPPLPPSPPY
jgi:hypothetical protein